MRAGRGLGYDTQDTFKPVVFCRMLVNNVVFPVPKKPLMMVTGTGIVVSAGRMKVVEGNISLSFIQEMMIFSQVGLAKADLIVSNNSSTSKIKLWIESKTTTTRQRE